ncbi:glycosyltransferase involved in cell wall biosynthesis [Devosia sp. UYZn731]|uniref:glycosyltransferase family 4 protein n=1 Tax=Devosia sp. UYZn731 TaxID=3156345 RepID=UPI003397C9B1
MSPLIVLATDSQDPSGLGEHMITLGEALSERFEIVLAGPNRALGMAFLGRAARRGLRIKAIDLDRLDLFTHWLRSSRASLLHVHAGIGWEGHDLVRHGKASALPVVRTEHLPYLLTSPVQQAAYRAMLQSVDARIAVSQAVFDTHAGQGGGRQTVVRNGIAHRPAAASAAELRATFGLLADDTIVLTVARFTPQKAHDVLVAAAPAVLQRNPKAKFLLVGSGPEQANIEAAIAKLGLADSFILPGHRDDIADMMAITDVFVLPSHFEGLPLAVLEAMAASVPVVATTIGGTIEAIGDAHPFLVPPGDAEALARAILRATAEPETARAATVAAAARHAEHFTAARMAAQTAEVYAPWLPTSFTQGANL